MENVVCMEEIGNAYKIPVRNPRRKGPHGGLQPDGRITVLKKGGVRVWAGFTYSG
jgi:hypothetical protein